jgi:hypothetical protein
MANKHTALRETERERERERDQSFERRVAM